MLKEGSATKKKILCTIFAEKLVLEKGKVATLSLEIIAHLIP